MEEPEASAAQVEIAESSAAARDPGDGEGKAIGYCPRCWALLEARSCKLLCPDCGYYMSCSDFY